MEGSRSFFLEEEWWDGAGRELVAGKVWDDDRDLAVVDLVGNDMGYRIWKGVVKGEDGSVSAPTSPSLPAPSSSRPSSRTCGGGRENVYWRRGVGRYGAWIGRW